MMGATRRPYATNEREAIRLTYGKLTPSVCYPALARTAFTRSRNSPSCCKLPKHSDGMRPGTAEAVRLRASEFELDRGTLVDIIETNRSMPDERGQAHSFSGGEHRYRTLFHAMPTSLLELDITRVRPILEVSAHIGSDQPAGSRQRLVTGLGAHPASHPVIFGSRWRISSNY